MKFPALRRASYFREKHSSVVVHREPRQLSIRHHRHEFLELVVILSGHGIHVTGEFRHRIQAGDVLVISGRRPHGYEQTRGLNLVNILVREDALPRLARDLRQLPGFHALFSLELAHWRKESYASRLRLSQVELLQVSEWADRLEEESMRTGYGGHVLAEAYLILIMGLLSRCYGKPSRLAGRSEGSMGRLLSWIEMHLPERLAIPLLAEKAGMSARSLHRHFNAVTGQSPADYILRQRIALSQELLKVTPDVRIGEVAAQCGFEDSNYFSRVFRSRTGLSPREFAQARQM